MEFQIGQTIRFAGVDSVVCSYETRDGRANYFIENGEDHLPMWVPEAVLITHQSEDKPAAVFSTRMPSVLVVDDFFVNPDEVRDIALAQEFVPDERYYKGLRSTTRFLWPYLREEFSRLLAKPVSEWLGHRANGCFQQTTMNDPLVWHPDTQQYAAAIYLTPNAPPSAGTSFWRDKTYGARFAPTHPYEVRRLKTDDAIRGALSVINDPYNITHGDNWELIESVAGLYNRLVIWDAQLIHSATSYNLADGDPSASRLVQLFFFDAL